MFVCVQTLRVTYFYSAPSVADGILFNAMTAECLYGI